MNIRKIEKINTELKNQLGVLLIDAVNEGSSVGFLRPIDETKAIKFWDEIEASLGDHHHLFILEKDQKAIGTVQVYFDAKESGHHRSEISKLLVHSSQRRQGIARKLMIHAQDFLKSNQKQLITLDTQTDSDANYLYQSLGYIKCGDIPHFAQDGDGSYHGTTVYYKRI